MRNNLTETITSIANSDVTRSLITLIRDEAFASGEAASWNVPCKSLFTNRIDTNSERCTVFSLPGFKPVDTPSESNSLEPFAGIFPWGRALCFRLLPYGLTFPAYSASSFDFLYLFDETIFLHKVPLTDELYESMAYCDMAMQSKAHPTYDELTQTGLPKEEKIKPIFKNYYIDEHGDYWRIPTPTRPNPPASLPAEKWEDDIPF